MASPSTGAIAGDRAREHIINHHRRDGGSKTQSGREQCLGNARRDYREIGGVRFRDSDKAVHDAPHGPEEADKGRRRTDGGEHAGRARNAPAEACLEALKPRCNPLLDAVAIKTVGGKLKLGSSSCEELPDLAAPMCKPLTPSIVESTPASTFKPERTRRRATKISMVLASHTVQVTNEAMTSPINTPLTTGIGVLEHAPMG